MMNSAELQALRTAANKVLTPGKDESTTVDTDWQDLFYKTGVTTSHDLGLSGGN
jgi:hypothetical protein